MSAIALAPSPAPLAASTAVRRDADARAADKADFTAALDEAAATEASPPARPRARTVADDTTEAVPGEREPETTSRDAETVAPVPPTPEGSLTVPAILPPATALADTPVDDAGDTTPVDAAEPPAAEGSGLADVPLPTVPVPLPIVPAPKAGLPATPDPEAQTPRLTRNELAAPSAPDAGNDGAAQTDPAPSPAPAPEAELSAEADLAARTASLRLQSEAAAAGRPSLLQTAAAAAAVPRVVRRDEGVSAPVQPAEPVESVEAGAVPEETPSPSTPVTTDVRHTRDVIDRALAARPAGSGPTGPGAGTSQGTTTGTTTGTSTGSGADPNAAGTPTASAASPSTVAAPAPGGEALATTALPVAEVQTPDPALPSAQAAATEARALEAAQSPSLSTTSRASVETTAQIAAQIVRKLEGRSTRFEMALTPEGLGQVDVRLDIDADGQLAARLAFDNPLAATELRGRVDELRRQLQEAGFTVADDALSFSHRDASAGQGGAFDRRPDPRNGRAFGAASRLSAEADLAATPPRWIPLTLTPERVDMKV